MITSRCADCGLGTVTAGEWYMVKDDVWEAAWTGRREPWHELPWQEILCIGCLEKRIGRTLVASDFSDDQINDRPRFKSARLHNRLSATVCAIAPIWDGNETWLVFSGLGLLTAFPLAFAIIGPSPRGAGPGSASDPTGRRGPRLKNLAAAND
jgi:hypothetical protein